MVQTKLT